jgi:amino acid transporter
MKKKMTLLGLIAATFFMVSGGPYGLEDLIGQVGYGMSIIVLCLVPLLWSLPTALMVGELASSIPDRGGFYIWVQRALGDFWAFQEVWLSLTASIFDMAIYPTLFVAYLSFLAPSLTAGWWGIAMGVGLITACYLWNLHGAHHVGKGSTWLGVLLLSPFALLTLEALWRAHTELPVTHGHPNFIAGLLVAMWNFMGWDNCSTIAAEVENPQKTYPRALMLTLGLIILSYVLPVAAMWHAGIPLSAWTTGSWAAVAGSLGGSLLRDGVVIGGVICAIGMLNSLMMSYSRLPYALAEDGFLPKIFMKENKHAVPWFSMLVLAVAWALCLGFSFEKLVMLDIMLYGVSLILEFVALGVLRWKEPDLVRPFRVPGGKVTAVLLGVAPIALLVLSAVEGEKDGMGLGLLLIAAGFVVWALAWVLRKPGNPETLPQTVAQIDTCVSGD